MLNKLLGALLVLSAVACGGPLQPAGEELVGVSQSELKAPAANTVRVSDSSTDPAFESQFSIANTYDVFFALDLTSKVRGAHTATYEVSAPSGAIYQVTNVAFTVSGTSGYRVWSSMPVAGTFIEQYSMSGTWKVKVFLDNGSTPTTTAAFVLQ
jgi:hypothetical protein